MIAQKDAWRTDSVGRLVKSALGAKDVHGMNVEDWPTLEIRITNLLQLMRIPAHIKGYHYLRKAILLEVESQDVGNTSAKVLFPKVAEHFGSTPDRVDRGIRYALVTAWKQCDFTALQKSYSFTTRFRYDKPKNLEFIACAADYYKLKSGI